MECILQWLDDLDDLVSALAMQAERFRRLFLGLAATVAALASLAGIVLAVLWLPVLGAVMAGGLLVPLWRRRSAHAGNRGLEPALPLD